MIGEKVFKRFENEWGIKKIYICELEWMPTHKVKER